MMISQGRGICVTQGVLLVASGFQADAVIKDRSVAMSLGDPEKVRMLLGGAG
jgi:hypothetical protein